MGLPDISLSTQVEHTLLFGQMGNAASVQSAGWSGPEDGFTWSVGNSSTLVLPALHAPHGFFVELHAAPLPPVQRIRVRINGAVIGKTRLQRAARLAWHSPPIQPGTDIEILFEHPDASRPDGPDDRPLALCFFSLRILALHGPILSVCVRKISAAATTLEAIRNTGLSVGSIVTSFESVGENCELGFLQRRCGAEPLGLLRFSTAPLDSLVRGLDSGFAGLEELENLIPDRNERNPSDHEWCMIDRRYGLRYHTGLHTHEIGPSGLCEREARRLGFLRRKFLADVSEGEKIFVHQRAVAISLEEILPLFLALRRYGPARLLWLLPPDGNVLRGTVEEVLPGLWRGRLGRFTQPGNHGDPSVDEWLLVLANCEIALRRHPSARSTSWGGSWT